MLLDGRAHEEVGGQIGLGDVPHNIVETLLAGATVPGANCTAHRRAVFFPRVPEEKNVWIGALSYCATLCAPAQSAILPARSAILFDAFIALALVPTSLPARGCLVLAAHTDTSTSSNVALLSTIVARDCDTLEAASEVTALAVSGRALRVVGACEYNGALEMVVLANESASVQLWRSARRGMVGVREGQLTGMRDEFLHEPASG